jgi:hypothetical protein
VARGRPNSDSMNRKDDPCGLPGTYAVRVCIGPCLSNLVMGETAMTADCRCNGGVPPPLCGCQTPVERKCVTIQIKKRELARFPRSIADPVGSTLDFRYRYSR